MELKLCPWQKTRMSPSKNNLQLIADFIIARGSPESMMEIGAGNSTWYLHQLNFNKYVAVETYLPVVKKVKEQNFSNFLLIDKWVDIPIMEYQYIFIDSNVGGDANKHQRHKPLIYAMDNNLLKKDALIIVHDYNKIKFYRNNIGSKRSMPYVDWFAMEDKYNLKIIKEFGSEFCIYERSKL